MKEIIFYTTIVFGYYGLLVFLGRKLPRLYGTRKFYVGAFISFMFYLAMVVRHTLLFRETGKFHAV